MRFELLVQDGRAVRFREVLVRKHQSLLETLEANRMSVKSIREHEGKAGIAMAMPTRCQLLCLDASCCC